MRVRHEAPGGTSGPDTGTHRGLSLPPGGGPRFPEHGRLLGCLCLSRIIPQGGERQRLVVNLGLVPTLILRQALTFEPQFRHS